MLLFTTEEHMVPHLRSAAVSGVIVQLQSMHKTCTAFECSFVQVEVVVGCVTPGVVFDRS